VVAVGGQPDGREGEEIDPVFYLLFMSSERERDILNTNTRVSPNDLLVAMGNGS